MRLGHTTRRRWTPAEKGLLKIFRQTRAALMTCRKPQEQGFRHAFRRPSAASPRDFRETAATRQRKAHNSSITTEKRPPLESESSTAQHSTAQQHAAPQQHKPPPQQHKRPRRGGGGQAARGGAGGGGDARAHQAARGRDGGRRDARAIVLAPEPPQPGRGVSGWPVAYVWMQASARPHRVISRLSAQFFCHCCEYAPAAVTTEHKTTSTASGRVDFLP